ncbi:hypothetical protein PV783_17335 [Chitinophaga sp. CC14]|uniref:hypothetical protein n=1 Tax=Chitinophaga sp. CC14 TaxID=3029199 RepID=UPI003B7DDE32
MTLIEQLFLLLELFMKKTEEERQQKAWNMFHSFFILFPPATIKNMINDLAAFSQDRKDIAESEKQKLLAFCKYLSVSLSLLRNEVNNRKAITDIRAEIFSDNDRSL